MGVEGSIPPVRGDWTLLPLLQIFSKCFMSLLKGFWKTNICFLVLIISNDVQVFSFNC